MLKNKKRIIIRNERLKKIRNSLREFWIRLVYDEMDILQNFYNLYDWSDLSLEEKNESGILQGKITNLFGLISKSICSCPLCTNTDRDMVYIPDHETWYCIECQKKGLNHKARKLRNTKKNGFLNVKCQGAVAHITCLRGL